MIFRHKQVFTQENLLSLNTEDLIYQEYIHQIAHKVVLEIYINLEV